MDPLGDRLALVTGGGSGIGRAICERLARDGARVAAADIDLRAAEETVAHILDAGGRARALLMDITDFARVSEAVDDLQAAWGPVDILVNNAGWDRMQAFVDTTPDFWDTVIAINLRGPIHCCRAVLDAMIARKSGKIIFMSSDAARVGTSGEAVYTACKGGVTAFAKSLARELAPHRINVNVVCPGPTDTPLIQRMAAEDSPKLVEALTRAIPFRRLARAEEIAAAVAFFASPDADFITGQVLSVSGGLTMVG